MASEWARKKVSDIIGVSFIEHDDLCGRGDNVEACDCGVEELEGKIAAALDEALERAEKAEANAALIARAPELLAENEELMEAHQALGHEYEMLAREIDKLKADLDAALMVLESVCPAGRWTNFHADPSGRVLQLLAEREV